MEKITGSQSLWYCNWFESGNEFQKHFIYVVLYDLFNPEGVFLLLIQINPEMLRRGVQEERDRVTSDTQ